MIGNDFPDWIDFKRISYWCLRPLQLATYFPLTQQNWLLHTCVEGWFHMSCSYRAGVVDNKDNTKSLG